MSPPGRDVPGKSHESFQGDVVTPGMLLLQSGPNRQFHFQIKSGNASRFFKESKKSLVPLRPSRPKKFKMNPLCFLEKPPHVATKRSDLRSGRAPWQSSIALRQATSGAHLPGPGGFARHSLRPAAHRIVDGIGEGKAKPDALLRIGRGDGAGRRDRASGSITVLIR